MSLLKDLSGNPEWQGIIKAARAMNPELPAWTSDHETPASEWIYKSGMKAGFELCLQIFTKLK